MLRTENTLLSALAPRDAELLATLVTPVTLKQGDVLFEPDQIIDYVYFFDGGLSSEIASNGGGSRIEVGCVGREGFSGAPVALGMDRTPHQSFMQSDGHALRIPRQALQEAMDVSPTLRRLLLGYVHVFMTQVAATALADGRYNVEMRLARWLLMSQDRLGDEMPLTHDFLSLMLGVRRPSVTDTLHIVEEKRAIRAQRGLITVRDRQKLEEIAGDCYGVPEAEYRRVIASMWSRP